MNRLSTRTVPASFFGQLAAKSANRPKAASALCKEAMRRRGAGALAAIAKSYGRLAVNDLAVVAGPRQLRRWSLLHPVAASLIRAGLGIIEP